MVSWPIKDPCNRVTLFFRFLLAFSRNDAWYTFFSLYTCLTDTRNPFTYTLNQEIFAASVIIKNSTFVTNFKFLRCHASITYCTTNMTPYVHIPFTLHFTSVRFTSLIEPLLPVGVEGLQRAFPVHNNTQIPWTKACYRIHDPWNSLELAIKEHGTSMFQPFLGEGWWRVPQQMLRTQRSL